MSSPPVKHDPERRDVAADTTPELTARPRSWSQAIDADVDEEYASLEPDELGEHALREATQSGTSASEVQAQLSPSAPSASDEPLRGPQFDMEAHDVWEETVDQALELGTAGGAAARRDPRMAADRSQADEQTWSRDVDLRQSTIVEASLFDAGSEETIAETRDPDVNADNASAEHVTTGDEGAEAKPGRRNTVATQSAGGRGISRRPAQGARQPKGSAATQRSSAASASNQVRAKRDR